MDHRRFILFIVFFFAFTYLYNGFIRPQFFPEPPEPAPVLENGLVEEERDDEDAPAAVAADTSENQRVELDVHPSRQLSLGSLEPESHYFLKVDLTTAGAAIESVQLTDPEFGALDDPDRQVTVIGNNQTDDRTFSTAVTQIDEQLAEYDTSLEQVHWKVEEATTSQVRFSFESPDHTLRVEKTYTLKKADVEEGDLRYAYQHNTDGYTIELDLTVTNLSDAPQVVNYELQGPVGIVLENRAHTRKYRDIKLEFLGEDDDVTMSTKELSELYAEFVAEARAEGKVLSEDQVRDLIRQKDPWTGAFRYAGIDVQFFAALIAPIDQRDSGERVNDRWIDRTYPVMIEEDTANIYESDISFRMASTPQQLEASGQADSVTHQYAFFVGPKRSTLLDQPPFEAEQVLDIGTGFFSFFGLTGIIARLMAFLLGTFHNLGIPYGICIILLTVLVRGCMFPISRKQAISAARMKELQPKINELKTKYGEDKQKLAQAQMELWRKHNINPLAGCFPVLMQMPIFIGLYQCLNTAVDLRLSSFLWIENLAAPDAMFSFPFPTPSWVGPHINVLPLVTVVLFLIQQKLFMPPPADEQAEMTQKMMNMMTLMFGALFWHQPAGLCVYFICSSLWGITERKLLGHTKVDLKDDDEDVPSVIVKDPKAGNAKAGNAKAGRKNTLPGAAAANDEPPKKGFFAKLMEAAEEAQKQSEQMREKERKPKRGKGSAKSRKKGR